MSEDLSKRIDELKRSSERAREALKELEKVKEEIDRLYKEAGKRLRTSK